MAKESSFLNDVHFQDILLGFLVHDREFLRAASHLLTEKDFEGLDKASGKERLVCARLALEFWSRYRQPIGKMLKVELIDAARKQGWTGGSKDNLLSYGDTLTSSKNKRIAPDAVLEKVRQYRTEIELTRAIGTMQDQLETGGLDMKSFMTIARQVIDRVSVGEDRPRDIFALSELERRIERRLLQNTRQRFPVSLIDPLDRLVRLIARKHLGLILAPYKRGKTMLFVWLALAYTLQGLNVIHWTLEDPPEDVEDRFDAAITNLPMAKLAEDSDRIRRRFKRYRRLLRTRLKVMDGTGGDTTIQRVENIYEQERQRGFMADVILIDYDDEIKAVKKQQERRMEFADIYRDYRAMLSRHELIGWTASQTSRKSDEMKIITGKHIAEDISKIRKCAMALSLGQGEWGEDSVFLWVAAHRNDRQHVGGNIMTDRKRSVFYDRDATLAQEKVDRLKADAGAHK